MTMPRLGSLMPRSKDGCPSSLLFHWRDADLTLDPLTGQADTFSRASVGSLRDRSGRLAVGVHSYPRFGFDASAGLHLLLESARTNGFSRSSELDNAAWTKTRSVATADQVKAPDGTTTADRFREDATAASTHFFERATGALTDNTFTTYSLFAKAAERVKIQIETINKANTSRTARINLSTGVNESSTAGLRVVVEPYADGWYRIAVSFDANTGATAPLVRVYLVTGTSTTSYSGDNVSGVYIWGQQLEINQPFATSYIPTTTGTVARSADLLTYPANWGVQDNETWYLKFGVDGKLANTGTFADQFLLSRGASGARMGVYFEAASRNVVGYIRDASTARTASVAIPAGPTADVVVQFRSILSAGTVQIHSAAASSAVSAATGPISSLTATLVLGDAAWSAGSCLNGWLKTAKIDNAVQTLDAMRGKW